jgi:hypothetical protein
MSLKLSYAAATTKNVPQSFPSPSEMFPDELGAKKNNSPSLSEKPNSRGVNGNGNIGLKRTTEDFPPIGGQIFGKYFSIYLTQRIAI